MPRILLVEDDVSLANLYKTELELEGHEVTVHTDGGNVTELAVKLNPDLVLLDIQLPQKDGLTILKELKQNEKTRNAKVVMLTNYATDDHIKEALDNGAEDFIPKFKIVASELSQKVKDILM
jgi:DNA-binding response OmpR family regulator